MPRVHGLLTTFLIYNKLKLCKGIYQATSWVRVICYKERLSRLDIDSLEMRRLRHDLLYSYKIVFNL